MSFKILITGKPGIGKTTIIKKAINALQERGFEVDGFYTQEVRENKNRVGFKIIGIRNFEGMLAHINFKTDYRVGKYHVKLDDLEECIGNISDPEVIVVDEIGKMELFSEKFREFIERILSEDRNVIASVGEKFVYGFVNKFKGCDLFRITIDNRDLAVNSIVEGVLR